MLSSYFVKAQDTTNYQRINVVTSLYPKGPVTHIDSIFYNFIDPGTFFVDLCEGFHDSVSIYINNKCIKDEFLETNYSIGQAGGFVVSFSHEYKIVLTILFKNAKRFIREELKPGYKHLEIRGLRDWLFIYSNHFYLAE